MKHVVYPYLYPKKEEDEMLPEVGFSGDYRTTKQQPRVKMRAEIFQSGDHVSSQRKPRVTTRLKLIPELQFSGDNVTTRRMHRTNLRNKLNAEMMAGELGKVIAEGSSDPLALQLIMNRFCKNTALVTATGGGNIMSLRCLFLKGRIVVMPAHLLQLVPGDIMLEFMTCYGNYKGIPLDKCDIIDDESRDLAFLQLPQNVTEFPDITNHFITSSDVCAGNISEGLMYTYNVNPYCPGIMQRLNGVKRIGKISYDLDTNGTTIPCHTIDSIEYKCDTSSGMCGSPIVVMNSKIAKKIMGFHVAGSVSRGIGTVVTKEYIDLALEAWSDIVVPEEPVVSPITDVPPIMVEAQGCVGVLGLVDKCKALYINQKSDIIKSPIFEMMYPAVTKPSLMKRTRKLDPMKKGIEKYFDKSILILDDLTYIRNTMIGDLKVMDALPKEKEILTIEEAINGVDTYDFLTPINLDTSVGYPYSNMELPLQKGKRKMLEFVDGKWLPGPILHAMYTKRLEKARKGIAAITIWSDNLKDERRAIAKVDAGKTRVFVTGPFDYTILFRQYFLGFTSFIMRHRLDYECAVGINPHSYEWTLLWKRLAHFDKCRWIAGDFSAYDGRLPTQVMRTVCDVVNKWYDDGYENALIRQVLFLSIYGSYHIVDNVVYRVNHGNPSGNPFTAVMNSLANSILMQFAFLDIGKELRWDLDTYRKFVRSTNYGDDNLLCVSIEIPDFNMLNISKSLRKIGVVYTSNDKEGELSEYTQRSDVSFLKRKFVFCRHVNGMLAPLDFNSISEMLNWIRIGQPEEEALTANVRSALMEMFHYGPNDFTTFKKELDECLIEKQIRPEATRWLTYYNIWSGEKYVNIHAL